MQVSIIVVNWNGNRHLPGLMAALAQQTLRDFELIFVDNGSTDNSVQLMEESSRAYGLHLRVIRNTENRGFAVACNQGIAAATTDWVAMLNNDTVPEPEWLARLVSTVDLAPRVGMVAAKMLSLGRPGTIDSAGIAVDWTGIAWDWRGGEMDDPAETAVREIFGPCAGSALYSKRMLEQVGVFDPSYFIYMEDVDLAWRARLAGWRCLYQPQARILHAHSATFGDASPRKRFLLGRNKVWLIAKNMPEPWLALWLPFIAGYDAMAVGYGVIQRGDLASLRGRLAGLAGLPTVWSKRREVQRRIEDVENWRRWMQPMVAPWQVPARYRHLAPGAQVKQAHKESR
ncbi:MAG: glycosyltransferase family 2 protein [Anaerolineales bacterium]|nr:glycosyltransferase family 2 protein [Anaerolineales bacterium]